MRRYMATSKWVAVLVMLLGVIPAPAFSAQIFLSAMGFAEGVALENPQISAMPGETITLYIWVRPDSGMAITTMGLHVESSNAGLVEPVGSQVFNPNIVFSAFGGVDVNDRWFGVNNGVPGPVPGTRLFSELNGSVATSGTGISDQNRGLIDPARQLDELYDPSIDAFLYGSFDVRAGSDVGSTDLRLAVGRTLIVEGTAVDENLQLGFGDDPISASNEGLVSSLADATIEVVVPEPASLALLLVGGAMVHHRRRQRHDA